MIAFHQTCLLKVPRIALCFPHRYTRASFLFPEQQPAPHTSFDQASPALQHAHFALSRACSWKAIVPTAGLSLDQPCPALLLPYTPPDPAPCLPPSRSYLQECDALKSAFAGLGSSSAYVLGDGLNGLQWHVFVAGTENAHATAEKPLYTLEVRMGGLACISAHGWAHMRHDAARAARLEARERPWHTGGATCPSALLIALPPNTVLLQLSPAPEPFLVPQVCMTGLAPSKAAQFFRSDAYISAQHTTLTSGIQDLVPNAGGCPAWLQMCGAACGPGM